MENLEKIRTELLASHKKIANGLNLAEGKNVTIDGIYFFISNSTFLSRNYYGDLELEVYEHMGYKKIAVIGDISEAIKALYKPMKQWKKIRKSLIDNI